MPLLTKVRSLGQAASALAGTNALKQLNRLREVSPDKISNLMAVEDGKLRPVIRSMLLANLKSSGIRRVTGTLERAIADVLVDISKNNIFIHMPPGVIYPNSKKGNVYAAAGSFRYGAVHQPLTKTHYTDLPTGERRALKKGRGGQYGQKVKAAVKRVALKGGNLTAREAKGKSGKALSDLSSGKISVIKPRPPFFELRPEQYKKLESLRFEGARRVFKTLGILVQ